MLSIRMFCSIYFVLNTKTDIRKYAEHKILSDPDRAQMYFQIENEGVPPSPAPLKPTPEPKTQTRPKRKPIVVTENVQERQLDVVIPPEKVAPMIDLEIVQLLLGTRNIDNKHILDDTVSNEYHRRFTLQLQNKQGNWSLSGDGDSHHRLRCLVRTGFSLI